MKKGYISIILFLTFGFLSISTVYATHNRAGEITFKQIGKTTYEITVVTFTKVESPVDREKLTIFWGDNTQTEVARDEKVRLGNEKHGIFRNIYRHEHTYAGTGIYKISVEDPNRIGDIVNMSNPLNTPFFIQTQLIIPSVGVNNSPVLLQPPIDFAETNQIFIHNPNAYDPDGDSLKFSLITPLQSEDKKVDGYTEPPAANSFSIDAYTGEIVWDYPTATGVYNIAILIEEFRQDQDGEYNRIGYVIRDMQIIVKPGNNKPPQIEELRDTCVEAGTTFTLKVLVRATDPDKLDKVSMQATGGPFLQNNSPASFSAPSPDTGLQVATFEWDVSCSHIRESPYRVVFRAQDDDPEIPLADLEHIDIKVIGPAPQNPVAEAQPQSIKISWDLPGCKNAIGYRVFRRIDTSFWDPDYCETGVPAYTGFDLIETLVGRDKTTYEDQSAAPGAVYCYRITAVYPNARQPIPVEGYASKEICDRLKKDIPVITHVDVLETSTDKGRIFVDWSKPSELDSTIYEPPYKYKVFSSPGFNGTNLTLQKVVDSIPSFKSLITGNIDSVFIHNDINTRESPYSYKIEFYGSTEDSTGTMKEIHIGDSKVSSSVYLTINKAHRALNLTWRENVLWQNKQYVIFKQDTSGNFKPIDTTGQQEYTDTGLNLGQTYCYYIQSIGSFSAPGFVDPVLNNSQVSCNEPRDSIAPCPPALDAQADCDSRTNLLQWVYDFTNPECDSDVVSYNIYFKHHRGKAYYLAGSVSGTLNMEHIDDRDTLRESLAGCYVVTAVDSFGNESPYSNQVCVDNCPRFLLPNVFTPNDDGKNDLFRPMPESRFIKKVDFRVYNRWGQVVFETEDPEINWDGRDMQSGEKLAAGTYYYHIIVYELFLDKEVSQEQKGTITLIR